MEKHRTRSIEFKGTAHPTDQSRLPRVATGVREGHRQPQEGHAPDEAKWLDRAPRRRFIATTDSEHDGPIFSNLAKKSLTTGASSRSPTSPTSRSRPASFISVRSWTLG
jgi:hypothetical protein